MAFMRRRAAARFKVSGDTSDSGTFVNCTKDTASEAEKHHCDAVFSRWKGL